MTYAVRYYNDVTKEVFRAEEINIDRIDNRTFKRIVGVLFEEAGESYMNRSLFADVYPCDVDKLKDIPINSLGLLTIACETTTDGETIDAHIFVNSCHVRNMNIAC